MILHPSPKCAEYKHYKETPLHHDQEGGHDPHVNTPSTEPTVGHDDRETLPG